MGQSDEMEDQIKLELTNWSVDGGLPDAYSTLSSLQKMDLASMPISQLPSNFHFLTNLTSLELRNCHYLCEIPSLPPTLVDLDLGGSRHLRAILCLSSLTELRDLVLCDCTELEELAGLDCLVHLSQLNITGCQGLISLPSGLEKLTSLKFLYMAGSGVSLLQDNEPWIQKLPSLELISVYADEVPECLVNEVRPECLIKQEHRQEHGNVCLIELIAGSEVAYMAALIFYFVSFERWMVRNEDMIQEMGKCRGRYQMCYTSGAYNIEIIEREADSPKFSQVLFVNRGEYERNQLHISIFRESHPSVASLECGNTIRVLAETWEGNIIEGAAGGAVRGGEKELDQSLRELSRQVELKRQEELTRQVEVESLLIKGCCRLSL